MHDNSISFDFESNQVEVFAKKNCQELYSIIEKVERTIDYIYKKKYQFSIYFVSSETIRNLNNQYRYIDEATDVLSFAEIDFISTSNFKIANKKEYKNRKKKFSARKMVQIHAFVPSAAAECAV